MAVKTFTKTDKTKLSEHFNISEFHCKGAKCGCGETLHDPALSQYLQQIRDHFGKPLVVTSGYRCKKHNEAVGGVSGSLHTKGQAADFVISGIKPLEIAKFAEDLGIKGIGLYDDFVHIDTRSNRFYWYGHAQQPRQTFQEVAPADVYMVTCRIGGMDGVHTLLFDGTVGDQIQPLTGYAVAVEMTQENGNADFKVVSLGTNRAEILKVRKLDV